MLEPVVQPVRKYRIVSRPASVLRIIVIADLDMHRTAQCSEDVCHSSQMMPMAGLNQIARQQAKLNLWMRFHLLHQ